MMPHTKQASFDSDLSFDLLGPMNAVSPHATFAQQQPGLAVSSGHSSSMHGNAWKRQSLPVTNSYGSLLARTDFDDLRARRAGDRSSMNSISNGLPDHAARSRAWNYEDQFKYRDAPMGGARERVQRDSPVIAELRTNVIIKDEFTLVTDLSYHLASRYSRPDASIMVKVDHSACLALAGTFDPCYILSITAVPSQMGPVNNKRNAALIQSFMADILSVPPDRGIIKFMTMCEENLAINGSTLLADIERQEKQHSADNPGARRTMTNGSRKSMPSFRNGVPKVDEEGHAELVAVNGTMRARIVNNGPPEAPAVFELPGEIDRRRPQTVHSGSEGVSTQPVPDPELMPAEATPSLSERPKSMGSKVSSAPGQPLSAKDRLPSQRSLAQKSSLPRTNSHPPRPYERQPVYSTQKPPTQMLSPLPPVQKTTAPGARYSRIITPDTKLRPHDSYLDGLSDVIPVLPPEPDDDNNSAADRNDTTANTAKRRSTAITAFPKVPPPPPPVPAETTSVKSVKIGKRKSFLSAFRRGIATTAH